MSQRDRQRSEFSVGRVSGDVAEQSEASVPQGTKWVSWLFMVGSACFAVASIPMLASVVSDGAIGTTYFVGSLFFTSASFLVAATTWRDIRGGDDRGGARWSALGSLAWWAAMIQLVGTLWFNINTFNAMQEGLTTQEENLRVWTPDFLGSTCFLISSYLSVYSVCGRAFCIRRHERIWQIAGYNLVGSVFFMAAALAAFTLPATGDALDASIANTGTMLGALCFLWGARLLLVADSVETSNSG